MCVSESLGQPRNESDTQPGTRNGTYKSSTYLDLYIFSQVPYFSGGSLGGRSNQECFDWNEKQKITGIAGILPK